MRMLNDLVSTVLVFALTVTPAIADVVAVVSSKSAVTTLSKNQITDIFLGKSAQFPNGGPAVPRPDRRYGGAR